MKEKYKQIAIWIKKRIKAVTPGRNAVRGASIGILLVVGCLWVLFVVLKAVEISDLNILVLALGLTLAAVLFGFIARWLLKKLSNVPAFYQLALLISIPLLDLMSFEWAAPTFVLVLASLSGAAILTLTETGFQNLSMPKRIITIMGMVVGFGGFIAAGIVYGKKGYDVDPLVHAAWSAEANVQQISAISPAQNGAFLVKTLSYGSGQDLHRPEYGAAVDIKTDSVYGLPFIDNWKGIGGWWREKYFGFDERALPVNGRVWYPAGEGPFPLVLIVHGNHPMQDFSDPGYAYLGDMLASKGMIVASVDENFLNLSWSDFFGGLKKENDARAWLLLEHLRVWHEWNAAPDHVFYQKIDTSNLALIGHSRGGEAVAHAALFNELPFYPDDAAFKFDYNYHLKSIIAIAPVDGQYQPGDTRTAISNVNYLTVHGAQDADVTSFMGSKQYERLTFSDSLYHFKSGIYVYGANHGQFNSTWGANDTGNPFIGLLNLKQQISAADQLEVAKVYVGAFLDVTLKEKEEYLPLFVDARKAKDWLPELIYLSQFEDSSFKPLARFDEDFDVTSVTQAKGKVSTQNLSVWREQEIDLKSGIKGSRALFVGWHYDLKDGDNTDEAIPDSLIARYSISFNPIALDTSAVLVFNMAESQESTNPKTKGKWVEDEVEKLDSEASQEEIDQSEDQEKEKEKDKKEEPREPIDLSIQLQNTTGQTVSFPLSDFSPLQRTIEVTLLKTGFLKGETESEKIFQTFYFPVEKIQRDNPNFDFSILEKVSFVFDKSDRGVVVIDDVGFMNQLQR